MDRTCVLVLVAVNGVALAPPFPKLIGDLVAHNLRACVFMRVRVRQRVCACGCARLCEHLSNCCERAGEYYVRARVKVNANLKVGTNVCARACVHLRAG